MQKLAFWIIDQFMLHDFNTVSLVSLDGATPAAPLLNFVTACIRPANQIQLMTEVSVEVIDSDAQIRENISTSAGFICERIASLKWSLPFDAS